MIKDGIEYKECNKCGKLCAKLEMVKWETCKECVISEKDKEIEELKGKISVLLSCKNCSENKGGLICAKEYENKCLAQKIEFIKELEAQIEKMKCCYNCSKWNDGECEESPKTGIFFCADFKCDNWEMFK